MITGSTQNFPSSDLGRVHPTVGGSVSFDYPPVLVGVRVLIAED
jgi:hypothetical protein